MLFKSYTLISTLLSLSLASTYWDWQADVPTDDNGLENIDFKVALPKAEHIGFWWVGHSVDLVGSDSKVADMIILMEPQPDNDGKPQLNFEFDCFTRGASPDSPNCDTESGYVMCKISVSADYSSLFTVNISPVDGSSPRSWKATLYVEGRSYEIGRIKAPPSVKGMKNHARGYLDDCTGHENCTKKSPIYVDVWPLVLNKVVSTLSGFHETTHCPDEDTPQYHEFEDHWAVERS